LSHFWRTKEAHVVINTQNCNIIVRTVQIYTFNTRNTSRSCFQAALRTHHPRREMQSQMQRVHLHCLKAISPLLPNITSRNSLHRQYSVKLPSPTTSTPSNSFTLDSTGDGALHTLVLLRHGESQWNTENRYTGWCDVPLTPTGEDEARTAGRLMFESGIELDCAHTSLLKRASFSTNMCLNTSFQHWVPVNKTWRLNERHYGALQGYNKDTAFKELGIDQEMVMRMRRSYETPPPMMGDDHEFWHGRDRRYRDLTTEELNASRGESLKDCANRLRPYWEQVVKRDLRQGKKVLIVSHANTLRSLIKEIDDISDEDIKGMSIPTGVPLLYRLDKNLKPVLPSEIESRYGAELRGYTSQQTTDYGFNGVFIGDSSRLELIQSKRDLTNRDWQRIILNNIFNQTVEESEMSTANYRHISTSPIVDTRHLWWKVHEKMMGGQCLSTEYANMLLLRKMFHMLEEMVEGRKQQQLTKAGFQAMIQKLHLDSAGKVIPAFERADKERTRNMAHIDMIKKGYKKSHMDALIKEGVV